MERREAQPQQILQAKNIQFGTHGMCPWQGQSTEFKEQFSAMCYGIVQSISQ